MKAIKEHFEFLIARVFGTKVIGEDFEDGMKHICISYHFRGKIYVYKYYSEKIG